MRRRLLIAALAGLLCPACVYFNSLYNAERLFEQAERARTAGDMVEAERAYRASAEKAARSLRDHPDGPWADDALYLTARAHFWRGDDSTTVAALERLLLTTDDLDIRLGAHAYLAAVYVRTGNAKAALPQLDAVLRVAPSRGIAGFARLWRARARFASTDEVGAWDDLMIAVEAGGAVGREARVEWARRAVERDDPARARRAFASLLADAEAERWADTLRVLADRAAARWGAGPARALLEPAAEAPWPARSRDALALHRAELAVHDGDTAAALAEASAVAARGAPGIAGRARVAAARWMLAGAADIAEVRDARAVLLPALPNPEARSLLRSLETFEALVERARDRGQHLGLFAAAELARDELHARGAARSLFIAYADAARRDVWVPKALLAAAALAPPGAEMDRIQERLVAYRRSVYLTALAGRPEGAEAFRRAEEELAAALAVLKEDVVRDVERKGAAVGYAASVLDGLRTVGAGGGLPMADTLGPRP